MLIEHRCAWSADPACAIVPDPMFDTLLDGCRWCKRCGPLQIERQATVKALIDSGYDDRLESALEIVELAPLASRS